MDRSERDDGAPTEPLAGRRSSDRRGPDEDASFERIANPRASSVTAQAFGALPLRESAPEAFDEHVERYGNLLDHALEQRVYRIDYALSDGLRAMAEDLGFLRTTPRDIVEIHAAALARRQTSMTPERLSAYMEEGRMALLELMGYLASYYRKLSMGRAP